MVLPVSIAKIQHFFHMTKYFSDTMSLTSVSDLSAHEPFAHLRRDDLRAGGAAAVAGHDGTALDTDGAVFGVDDTLHHGEALVAQLLDRGLDLDAVVVVDLRTEVDIVVHDHDGEVTLGGREAVAAEEGFLA